MRSASIERDLHSPKAVGSYIAPRRATDFAGRVARAAADGRGGAWSVIGPYGCGKSFAAVVAAAALGPAGPVQHQAERALLASGDEAAAEALRDFRAALPDGMTISTAAAASREPAALTLARAIGMPAGSAATAEHVLSAARHRPMLIILDEFGKCLEAAASGAEGSDPYILQRLAEADPKEGAVYLAVLQHMSFEEHIEASSGSGSGGLGDWAKVQGRFSEVPFADSDSEMLSVARASLRAADGHTDGLSHDSRLRWAESQIARLSEAGISSVSVAEAADCWPLHPISAALLPALCSRYGQRERTLLAFIHEDLRAAAAEIAMPDDDCPGGLPSIGPEVLYGGLIEASGSLDTRRGRRWAEVSMRVRDARGLSTEADRALRIIAVANLVSGAGPMRASKTLLDACGIPDGAVEELERSGLAQHRRTADEYRIWQGTDADLDGAVGAGRESCEDVPTSQLLSDLIPAEAAMPARHNHAHCVPRAFRSVYADPGDTVNRPDAGDEADGLVVLCTSDQDSPTVVGDSRKPVVVIRAVPGTADRLRTAAVEAAAVAAATRTEEISSDRVAAAEMSERLSETTSRARAAAASAWGRGSVRVLVPEDGDGPEEALPDGGGSSYLSAAADRAYPLTPVIANETVNRTNLSSQGAKARRELATAMLEHPETAGLRLDGSGAAGAAYAAVLSSTGIHRRRDGDSQPSFGRPYEQQAGICGAWDVICGLLDGSADGGRIPLTAIYHKIWVPPHGMKAGPSPLVVLAAMLARRGSVAVYEHGSLRPHLTADLAERMLRNPDNFSLRDMAETAGDRRNLCRLICGKESGTVDAVRHILSRTRGMNRWAWQTQTASSTAQGVREALRTAAEPDDLLYVRLPVALGHSPLDVSDTAETDNAGLASDLRGVLDELVSLPDVLDARLLDAAIGDGPWDCAADVQDAADDVLETATEPDMRSAVLALSNRMHDDTAWARAVATVVSKKAPSEWSDGDLDAYETRMPEILGRLRRSSLAARAGRDGAVSVIATTAGGAEISCVADSPAAAPDGISRLSDSELESMMTTAASELLRRRIAPEATQ